MKLPSFLDWVANPVLGAFVVVLLLLQWRFPLRRQHYAVLRRLIRNYVVSNPGFIILTLPILHTPSPPGIWAEPRRLVLLHWSHLPGWPASPAGFIILDYAY